MIRIATPDDAKRWDAFVDQHANGSFCHLYGWANVISKAVGHQTHYLISEDSSGSVCGILPLVEMKSWLFGHTLSSTPFCMYGGAIANQHEQQVALEESAKTLAAKLNVDYLELRYQSQQVHLQGMQFTEKSAHCFFEKEIPESDDDILLAIKKKQRAVVRHALKNELDIKVNRDVDTLYKIYSISVRNLGTPVFSKKLFKSLLEEFCDNVDILTVYKDNSALSSVLSFYYKDMVMPYYGGGVEGARRHKSNDLMYYQLMCHAAKKGMNVFDFGRSKNESGAFKYKSTWGIEPKPLYHYFCLIKATELPDLSPNNPKYQKKIALWQKLPVSVSQIIGPFLSKYLG